MNFTRKTAALLLGPLLFIALLLLDPPSGMSKEAYLMLAITIWIAIWWISEAIPIAVTSLLPIVLFPLSGILDVGETTAAFGDKYVFLYLGGFI
uniref:anion permease n=1 Tax=Flavobacterium sp. TaxID=239 RepID=UPI00404AA3A9